MVLNWVRRMLERIEERRDERDRRDRERYNLSFRGNGKVATTVDKILRSPRFHEQIRVFARLRDSGFFEQG